jgi:hypothetical protein
VLEVDDLDEGYVRVTSAGWPLAEDLAGRPAWAVAPSSCCATAMRNGSMTDVTAGPYPARGRNHGPFGLMFLIFRTEAADCRTPVTGPVANPGWRTGAGVERN